jgi:IS30 family transposase
MSYKQFSLKQRNQLKALIDVGTEQKEIADVIEISESAISRELSRNGGKATYDPKKAHQRAKNRRKKANKRFNKIRTTEWLKRHIVRKLKKYWSPEQISGRLERNKGKKIISYEAIYQYIYTDRQDLKQYLRCQKGKYRRKRGTKARARQREAIKKRNIDQRPEIIEKRGRIGDWEGDTIVGTDRKSGILTHVDRRSGYLLADKLERKYKEIVAKATIRSFKNVPRKKKKSITYDNGTEFSDHEYIEKKAAMTVYFANPYHSWERGTNENTNGLLRQFFPKKCPLNAVTQEEVKEAEKSLNNRPRKRLGYLTPYEVFIKNCTLD